jgi:hypothetical protein
MKCFRIYNIETNNVPRGDFSWGICVLYVIYAGLNVIGSMNPVKLDKLVAIQAKPLPRSIHVTNPISSVWVQLNLF